jgi:hypothetical protein
MQQKYVQKPIKSNFVPSKFMTTTKVLFDHDGSVDKETGELRAKEFSLTCNVVDGTIAGFQPKAVVTIKCGNDSFRFIADNFDSISEAFFQASQFIQKQALKVNAVVIEEAKKYGEIAKARSTVRKAS